MGERVHPVAGGPCDPLAWSNGYAERPGALLGVAVQAIMQEEQVVGRASLKLALASATQAKLGDQPMRSQRPLPGVRSPSLLPGVAWFGARKAWVLPLARMRRWRELRKCGRQQRWRLSRVTLWRRLDALGGGHQPESAGRSSQVRWCISGHRLDLKIVGIVGTKVPGVERWFARPGWHGSCLRFVAWQMRSFVVRGQPEERDGGGG